MTEKPAILVAEDEEHIAKLVSFKLTREGFAVTVARDGREALEQLAARPWAVLVLDVMMPLVDGWQVLKHVRATPELSKLPVLMLTAKSYQRDVSNAAELGATQFLKKPFDPAELASAVRRLAGTE
jgi:DNA-binding response OmpR family regulator